MRNLRYGKYRARVVDLRDPQERGRVKVACPKVMGEGKSAWCEICVPCAYEGGGDFYLPKLNDTVWIEFEEGDPTKPIWVGSWWSIGNTSNRNYNNAEKLRIIEFDGCRIEMQKHQIKLSVDGNTLILNQEGISLQSNGSTQILSSNKMTLSSSSNVVVKGTRIDLN